MGRVRGRRGRRVRRGRRGGRGGGGGRVYLRVRRGGAEDIEAGREGGKGEKRKSMSEKDGKDRTEGRDGR